MCFFYSEDQHSGLHFSDDSCKVKEHNVTAQCCNINNYTFMCDNILWTLSYTLNPYLMKHCSWNRRERKTTTVFYSKTGISKHKQNKMIEILYVKRHSLCGFLILFLFSRWLIL